MKIVGIIPARYRSLRFPGKALANLLGTPMIVRVCETALLCTALDEVYVATDSPEIQKACEAHGFPVVMTGNNHKNPTSRVQEAAGRIPADLYVMIGGDEPLVTGEDIELVVKEAVDACSRAASSPGENPPYVVNAMTGMDSDAEINDPTNLKVVCGSGQKGLYISRLPLPFSGKDPGYPHKKFVSIGVYTKEALDFFARTPESRLEQAEECDLLRFLEHGKTVLFTDIRNHTHSVDTPKDLELVNDILRHKEHT